MALNRRTVIFGVKSLLFVRNGTADGEDTVGEAYAPDTDPLSALYESLGDAESGSIEPKEDMLILRSARSGRYKRRKTIPLGMDLAFKFKMQDVTQIMLESLFRFGGAITLGTAQAPMQQSTPITGFVWMDLTDQTGTSIIKGLVYAELRVNAKQIAEKEYSYELLVDVIENALNSINPAALANN